MKTRKGWTDVREYRRLGKVFAHGPDARAEARTAPIPEHILKHAAAENHERGEMTRQPYLSAGGWENVSHAVPR